MTVYLADGDPSLRTDLQSVADAGDFVGRARFFSQDRLRTFASSDREKLSGTSRAILEVIEENTLKTLNCREVQLQILAHKLLDQACDPSLTAEQRKLLNQAFIFICEALRTLEG